MRKVLQDLQEQAQSARVMLGADGRVFTKLYKSGNKLRWLQEYDALRERGVGMKAAMRAAYEVVRKAMKEAASKKGARRGVRSMFEGQRRKQEAQARERALEDGVPGDEENGGPQGSRQGQRPRGGRGAHRSLQEEWDTEEDSGGDGEVQGDEGATTQRQRILGLWSF